MYNLKDDFFLDLDENQNAIINNEYLNYSQINQR